LLSVLLYALGITARYPLAVGLQMPRAGWYTLSGYSLRAGLVFVVVIALLVICYSVALRLTLGLGGRNVRVPLMVIIGGWLLSSAALLGAYPGESFDIFDYIFRGRMLVEYGASPLATAPSAYRNQPFYQYITWRGQVDTYGPLWEYASGLVAWAVPSALGRADSQIAYVVGYRLLAVLLTGLSGVIITLTVRQSDPAYAPAALLAWLWNPLLVITTAVGAHNDIIMMLAVLVALLLFQRKRWVWGLLALALAAHVKLTALLILPVLGLWLVRQRGWYRSLRDGAAALVLSLSLSWLLYSPLGGWTTLRRMLQERTRLLINSPADLVYRVLQEQYGWTEPAAWRVTTLGATLVFCAGAAAALAWFWWSGRRPASGQHDTPPEALLWRGCIAVTLLYLFVGSFWFQHWYLLWVLAPSVLLPASRWTLTLLPAYCLGVLWGALANSFLPNLPARPLSVTQVSAVNVLAQVAPLVCMIGVLQLRRLVPPLRAALRRQRSMKWTTYHDPSRHT
jgi:hypothetical protein